MLVAIHMYNIYTLLVSEDTIIQTKTKDGNNTYYLQRARDGLQNNSAQTVYLLCQVKD